LAAIHHSIHLEDREVMAGMREQIAPMKGSITGPEARPLFDSMMLHVAAAEGVTYETATVGGGDGAWCRPVDAADASAAILYKESLEAISEFLEHQLRGSAITPSAWTDHVDGGDSRVEPE
jgi:hypothetical protein